MQSDKPRSLLLTIRFAIIRPHILLVVSRIQMMRQLVVCCPLAARSTFEASNNVERLPPRGRCCKSGRDPTPSLKAMLGTQSEPGTFVSSTFLPALISSSSKKDGISSFWLTARTGFGWSRNSAAPVLPRSYGQDEGTAALHLSFAITVCYDLSHGYSVTMLQSSVYVWRLPFFTVLFRAPRASRCLCFMASQISRARVSCAYVLVRWHWRHSSAICSFHQ